jgi:hypothetical protein
MLMADIRFGQTVIKNWFDKVPLEFSGSRRNRLFTNITFIILAVTALISATSTIN